MQIVETVALPVVRNFDIPVEATFEDAIAQAVHFGEIVGKRAVGRWRDELQHDELLTVATS